MLMPGGQPGDGGGGGGLGAGGIDWCINVILTILIFFQFRVC